MKKVPFFSLKRKKELSDSVPLRVESPRNEYYESVSVAFGSAQVILFVALFAFVVLSFIGNTELITYRNFYYFFQDLNASAETVDLTETDSMTYPTDDEQSFALYRNGLAVAGNRSVTVFSATGRQTVSKTISNYLHPTAVGSGKYLLVFESGGTHYSVYNAYNQLYAGSVDFPIQTAAVSDGGLFALVTASEDYTSEVFVYNDRFELVSRYYKNAFVMDVDINEKGTSLAILTSELDGGAFSTKLTLYKTKSGVAEWEIALGSSIGIDCIITDSASATVLCGNSVYFIGQDGKLKNSYLFEDRNLRCASLTDSGIALCLEDFGITEKNSVIVFDKSGNLLYNKDISEKAEQIVQEEDRVYVLFSGGIRQIFARSEREDRVILTDTEDRVLLAVRENEVLLCSPQKAVYFRF